MVKDMLDESSFEASPGSVLPTKVGQAAGRLVERLRDRSEGQHPE
jgi:pyruvate dehydrogenase (quinone)/pyruvate oxidase